MIFIKKTAIQVGLSTVWFIGMYSQYRNDFIQYHFIDSHFKRVTASIEQHFGQRTFYIDLLLEQLRYGIIPVVASSAFLGYAVLKRKSQDAYFSLIFVPWFIFLNLTKTKIAWYLYPVLPQFIYLSVFMLSYIKKQWIQGVISLGVLGYFFFSMAPINSYMTANFSTWEPHQRIAQDAQKAGCKELFVLVNDSSRTSYATLKSMDLVINTTTWWGNHPSMAYYSDVHTTYYYTVSEFEKLIKNSASKACFTTEKEDWNSKWSVKELAKNEKFILGIK